VRKSISRWEICGDATCSVGGESATGCIRMQRKMIWNLELIARDRDLGGESRLEIEIEISGYLNKDYLNYTILHC